MPDLTDRQAAILSYLREREAGGYAASVREIGAAAGIGINAVCGHLRSLEQMGLVTIQHGKARGVRVVPNEQDKRLARLAACWPSLPDHAQIELVSIGERYHQAVTVHEEVLAR